jgi:hypothetical protein
MQSGLSPESTAVPETADMTGHASAEQPEAVLITVPEPIPANIESDPHGEASDSGKAMHGAVIPPDAVVEPIKRTQQPRRKRRKTLPE